MSTAWPRVPEPDVAAHLSGAGPDDLGELTVTAVDLSGADLTGADLTGLQLEASALDRVRAGHGTWRRTTLVDCRLDGADLANLVAVEAAFVRCSLREVRLTGAQLPGARLRGVRLTGAQAPWSSWAGAELRDVVLDGCDLREADLAGARLTDVLLRGCDLTGVQLSGAVCRNVRLEDCRLTGLAGVRSLRGASVAEGDAYQLMPLMAGEMGIDIGPRSLWG